jgi:hypothetical protein
MINISKIMTDNMKILINQHIPPEMITFKSEGKTIFDSQE